MRHLAANDKRGVDKRSKAQMVRYRERLAGSVMPPRPGPPQ
jgi:hypothetical protein